MNVAPANWSKQSQLAHVATRGGFVQTVESRPSSRVSGMGLAFTSQNCCICLYFSSEGKKKNNPWLSVLVFFRLPRSVF